MTDLSEMLKVMGKIPCPDTNKLLMLSFCKNLPSRRHQFYFAICSQREGSSSQDDTLGESRIAVFCFTG